MPPKRLGRLRALPVVSRVISLILRLSSTTMSHGSGRAIIERHPQIEACEPRILLAVDSFVGDNATSMMIGQPDLSSLSTADSLRQVMEATDRDYVRETYGLTGEGQTVVVIDSGIAYDHQALGGGFGPDYRVVGGWDFAENDDDPYDDAPGGFHGTHLAGIIGSTDDTYSGLAPGVDLVALRVITDTGVSSYDWIEEALQWVQRHRSDFEYPVTTINISIGAGWNSDQVPSWAMLEDELRDLEKLGIFISVAAGNNFNATEGPGLNYPAASSHVVPVGSVDAQNQISRFSQRTDRILAAPGESIISTVPDYLYSFDGVPNDFGSVSGTSMAAPYVAGASVLLRQAMEIAGVNDINQDLLYEQFRKSADLTYDPITNNEYHRINLRNAIDTIMADDYGSSPGTAYPITTLNSDTTLPGHLRSLSDVDYFTFVAGYTGSVRIDLQDSKDLQAEVFLVQASGSEVATDSFSILSDETYMIGVQSLTGLGNYNLTLVAEHNVETDLGTIDSFATTIQIGPSGSERIRFRAKNAGWMTVTAPAGNREARLSLFDATGQLLATSRVGARSPTVTVHVDAGQELQLQIDTDEFAELELRFTNLVNQTGNQIVVHGTAGNDTFVFQAGPKQLLVVNGQIYHLESNQEYEIFINGERGEDRVIWYGSEANDTATISDSTATMRSTHYSLNATEVENISVRGGGGQDLLVLHDSAGDDRVSVTDRVTTLRTNATIARAFGFTKIKADATEGNDRVVFRVGKSGTAVKFTADSVQTSLVSETGEYTADGFTSVTAYGGGENSHAELSSAPGKDRFIGHPEESTFLTGGARITLRDFARVRVDSDNSNEDRARLYDSEGNDRLQMSPFHTTFAGEGFSYDVNGFSNVRVISSLGGSDLAILSDGAGDDRLVSRADWTYLKGDGYLNSVDGFEQVRVVAKSGGNDRALMLDLSSVETFFAKDERAGRISLNNNDLVEVEGFASVIARNASGGVPHREIDAVDFVLVNHLLSS